MFRSGANRGATLLNGAVESAETEVLMFRFLYAFFFGCFHKRTTFPMTVTSRSQVDGRVHRRTYVACLHCGEEFAYNWQKMRMEGVSRGLPLPSPALVSISRGFGRMQEMLAANTMTLSRFEGGSGGWVLDANGTLTSKQPAANQFASQKGTLTAVR